MYPTGGKNPYAYPKTFEEWSNNVKDAWVGIAKNTDIIPEGHTQVLIIRPNEGYGNYFNSLRVAIKNESGSIKVYTDMVGANADEKMAQKYKGMTIPDGDYYYTTNSPYNLITKKGNNYNSPSYKNILRLETNDLNIPEETRNKINSDMYLSHANVKNGRQYSNGPLGAGCNIVDGQKAQNNYINFLSPHVNETGVVDNISIKFISGVY